MGREDPAREANLAWSDEGVPFAPERRGPPDSARLCRRPPHAARGRLLPRLRARRRGVRGAAERALARRERDVRAADSAYNGPTLYLQLCTESDTGPVELER